MAMSFLPINAGIGLTGPTGPTYQAPPSGPQVGTPGMNARPNSGADAPRGPQGGNQGAFPDVQGGQYQSPGAAGVTKYGLFSNAGGGARTPGAFPTLPTLPPGISQRPPGGPQRPPMPTLPPGFQARPGAARARSPLDAPPAPQRLPGPSQVVGPVNNDPRALLNALRGGGNSRFGPGTGQQMTGQMGMGTGGPATMQQAPPPSSPNAGLQQQFNQQLAQAAAQQAARGQNALYGGNPQLGLGGYFLDAALGTGDQPYVDEGTKGNVENTAGAAGDVAGVAGSAAGGALGEGFSSFVDAWNAANPGSNMSYEDFLNIPGFDPSSLMGDVGQNWTSTMDPAAWEQMAQNRLGAANEANMGALNRGERRLADRAGRTGFANTGGVTSQMYQDYAGRGLQAERDIFNDTLMNQMNALQGAGQFALGQNAQDQARWAQLAAMAGHAADQNYGANREDNPSGAAVLGDLLGAAGGVAGGAMEGAGGIMSMLAPLFAAFGGV